MGKCKHVESSHLQPHWVSTVRHCLRPGLCECPSLGLSLRPALAWIHRPVPGHLPWAPPPAPPLAPIGCDSPGPAPGSLAPGHGPCLVLCPHRRRPLLHATRARARGCCVLTTPSRVLSLGGCLWGSKHQQKPAWGTLDGAPWAEAAAVLEAVRGDSCTPGPGRGHGDRTYRQNDCFPACEAPVGASHTCRFAGPSWRQGRGSTVLI